jgi:hypothetical protein
LFSCIGESFSIVDIAKATRIVIGKEVSIISGIVFWFRGYR